MKMRVVLACLVASVMMSGCSFSLFPSLKLSPENADVEFAEKAIGLEPKNAHAHFIVGRERLESGDTAAAREAFEKALSLQPDFVEARLGIGKAHLRDSEWREAAKAFDAALKVYPASIAAQEGLAEAHFGAGDLAKAESAAMAALGRNPASHAGNLVLGKIRYVQGRYEEAVQNWKSADETGELPVDVRPVYLDLQLYVKKYRATAQ